MASLVQYLQLWNLGADKEVLKRGRVITVRCMLPTGLTCLVSFIFSIFFSWLKDLTRLIHNMKVNYQSIKSSFSPNSFLWFVHWMHEGKQLILQIPWFPKPADRYFAVTWYPLTDHFTMGMFPLKVWIRIYLEKILNQQLSLSLVLMSAPSYY